MVIAVQTWRLASLGTSKCCGSPIALDQWHQEIRCANETRLQYADFEHVISRQSNASPKSEAIDILAFKKMIYCPKIEWCCVFYRMPNLRYQIASRPFGGKKSLYQPRSHCLLRLQGLSLIVLLFSTMSPTDEVTYRLLLVWCRIVLIN